MATPSLCSSSTLSTFVEFPLLIVLSAHAVTEAFGIHDWQNISDINISDVLFQKFNFRTLYISLRTNFDQQFLTLCQNIANLNLRLQNTFYTETTSVKITVLLHPQGFTDIPTRK